MCSSFTPIRPEQVDSNPKNIENNLMGPTPHTITRYEQVDRATLDKHLSSGEPFITNSIPFASTSGTHHMSLDSWSNSFEELWPRQETIQMWQGLQESSFISDEQRLRYHSDFKQAEMNFTNFNKVRESYDKTYLSIIANNREEIALVDTQFTPPEWFPSPNLQTKWM